MARTKQTARRSDGLPAPRKTCSLPTRASRPPSQAVHITVTLPAVEGKSSKSCSYMACTTDVVAALRAFLRDICASAAHSAICLKDARVRVYTAQLRATSDQDANMRAGFTEKHCFADPLKIHLDTAQRGYVREIHVDETGRITKDAVEDSED